MDSRFHFLWIACHTAFSKEASVVSLSDGQKFNQFLKNLVSHDTDNKAHKELWQQFTQAIRVLLDNQYVFQSERNAIAASLVMMIWKQISIKPKKAVQLTI